MKISPATTIIVFILFFLIASNSFGEVITNCGSSKGYSYYMANSVDKGGWKKDGVSEGQIIFMITNEKPDIIYRDITGKTTSVREDDKGAVHLLSSQNGEYMVLVIQGNTVHHYHFKVDPNGKGEVVWSTARPGFLSKGSLFVGECN